MSVKTLDDAEREIEVSDELESLLHVLVYESCKHLPSNCWDVAQFMSYYFDDGLRRGLRFFSGQTKRNSMTMGKIQQPDGAPLIFLRSRAHRPLPSRAYNRRASAYSPGAQATSEGPTVPDDPRHPIQAIIDELMPLFKAHYVDHQRQGIPRNLPAHERNSAEGGSKPRVKLDDAAAQFIPTLWNVRGRWLADPEPESEIEETAELLKSHHEFGRILVDAYQFAMWPENDKLLDQVHEVYNEEKRSTGITKESIQEDAPPIKKRKPIV